MKKYILICVAERCIYNCGLFSTLEEAQKKMKQVFIDSLKANNMLKDIDKNEFEDFLNGALKTEWLEDHFGFEGKSSYIECGDDYIDWEIIDIEV